MTTFLPLLQYAVHSVDWKYLNPSRGIVASDCTQPSMTNATS